MAIHPGMVEPLAERTRDLYAAAELRLLGNIARQLADGLHAPGWAERKLTSVTALRRSAQGVVDELGKTVRLDVFDAIAEAYNTGHRAAVAELGSLPDRARQLVDEITLNAQAVDSLAQETVDVVTSTHRSLTLTGPGGERTVEVEHALDDGRMIPVRVADSLDEARHTSACCQDVGEAAAGVRANATRRWGTAAIRSSPTTADRPC